MRFALSALLLALLATSASGQEPSTASSSEPIYFLIDASRSMKGNNQADALAHLRARSLPRGQRISVTYFGGSSSTSNVIDRCLEEIIPADSIIRQEDVPPFPELGGANEKTAIGKGIESILMAVGGKAKLVLITDGLEECNADFVELRKRYPYADITVQQVGPTPNPALQLLEVKPAQDAIKERPSEVTAGWALPPLQVVLRPFYQVEPVDHWADAEWLEKYLWLVAYFFAAASAACLGLSYIKMSTELENSNRRLERDRQRNAEIESKGNGDPKWPDILTLRDIVEVGRKDKIRSVFRFCLSRWFWAPHSRYRLVSISWQLVQF